MITTLALVKVLGKLYDKLGSSAPTSATAGEELDVYVDTSTGLSYTCISVTPSYTWQADTSRDFELNLYIGKAESDYLAIRGSPFSVDEFDQTIYPPSADIVAAEMVCYLAGIKEGRGKKDESLAGRSASYDDKIFGYPRSIVGTITRFQSAL